MGTTRTISQPRPELPASSVQVNSSRSTVCRSQFLCGVASLAAARRRHSHHGDAVRIYLREARRLEPPVMDAIVPVPPDGLFVALGSLEASRSHITGVADDGPVHNAGGATLGPVARASAALRRRWSHSAGPGRVLPGLKRGLAPVRRRRSLAQPIPLVDNEESGTSARPGPLALVSIPAQGGAPTSVPAPVLRSPQRSSIRLGPPDWTATVWAPAVAPSRQVERCQRPRPPPRRLLLRRRPTPRPTGTRVTQPRRHRTRPPLRGQATSEHTRGP